MKRVNKSTLVSGTFLAVVLAASAYAAGCGSDMPFDPNQPAGDGGDPDADPFGNKDGTTPVTVLDVKPKDPVIDYPTATTQQFQAFVSGGSTPIVANWAIDNGPLGGIDGTGLFKASGLLGGTGQVTATSGKASGSTSVSVVLHLAENPGNVSAGDQSKLLAGGNADAGFTWLYPYDKTVFPRGLTAPVLQFAGTAASSFYVHLKSKFLDYQGFFAGTNPAAITLPPATWKSVSQSVQANDPLSVEVTKLAGGLVTGPTKETWTIAQGALKGTVYYNSYNSPLAGNTGATLKMKVGQAVQVLMAGCNVCHAVSANGNVLASMHSNYVSGATYDLTNNAAPMAQTSTTAFSFAALYPDGAKLVSCGTLPGSWPPNVAGLSGNLPSTLYDTKTGAVIASTGLGTLKALMPAFSPDGTLMAFNHYEVDSGHSLGVMGFNNGTNTFSAITDLLTGSPQYVGWPAFLPDSKAVLFEIGTSNQYRSDGGQFGDLSVVDIATKTVATLDGLNGMAGGNPYLPYGAEDVHLNYEPTILPVAVGGYYWVLFTSRRYYGNTIVDASQDATPRKKLWVAAVDINAQPGKDGSHPAFYLPEQEQAAGNMRGFWALDPCKQNGSSCESGDECCGGYCRSDGDGGLACVPPPTGCAQEFEKCTTAADCCDTGSLCINGHCAKPPPN